MVPSMETIVIYTPKGGASKSTLTRELGTALSMKGKQVGLIDLDPQMSTTNWYNRRDDEMPMVIDHTANNLTKIKRAGVDYLIVDTPPGTHEQSEFFKKADLVVIPVKPSPDDLVVAMRIGEELKKKKFVYVVVQTPPRAKITESCARELAGVGKVAPVNMGFRVDYPTEAIHGKAAVEKKSSKANEEITKLTTYLLRQLKSKG